MRYACLSLIHCIPDLLAPRAHTGMEGGALFSLQPVLQFFQEGGELSGKPSALGSFVKSLLPWNPVRKVFKGTCGACRSGRSCMRRSSPPQARAEPPSMRCQSATLSQVSMDLHGLTQVAKAWCFGYMVHYMVAAGHNC